MAEQHINEAPEPLINHRVVLAILVCSTSVNILSTTIYMPALPKMAVEFGSDVSALQATLTAYLAASAIGQLIFGPLSDAIGRRRLLIGGLLCCAITSFGCSLVQSATTLIALRLLQGVGGSICLIMTRAVVRDINDRTGTATDMAAVMVSIALVPPLAHSFGGLLTDVYSWRAPFEFLAVFSAATLGAVVFALPETNRGVPQMPSALQYLQCYTRLLRSPKFLSYTAVHAILIATLYFFYAAGPAVLIGHLGLSPSTYGPVVAIASTGFLLGSLASNRRVARHGLDHLITIGSAVSGLAAIALFGLYWQHEATISLMMGAVFVWYIAYGIILPNALAGALSVHSDIAGAAAALAGFAQIAAGTLGSVAAYGVTRVDEMAVIMGAFAALTAAFGWAVSAGKVRNAS
jgi:MFS transporter, DHA1 family, multidrug resistance protein